MRALNIPFHDGRGIRRWLWVGCLIVLLALVLPTTALAATPDPDEAGPDRCAQCHPTEAATWRDSPHAGAEFPSAHDGVTCEVCHGAFVPEHPQHGVMQLSVDAACCQDCHTTTYEQWHEAAHAGAGVACASCHMPHSQETRLASEELCISCHREVVEDWAHHNADVHCTDCHLAFPFVPETSGDVRVMSGGMAPNHSFRPAAEACADCHGQSIHNEAVDETVALIDGAQLPSMAARAKDLAYELEDAKRINKTLRAMSVVSLGFGLGTGGVLGVIFVLVVGYVSQRSTSK
jgi:hypothetical protein